MISFTKPRVDVGFALGGEVASKVAGLVVMMVLTRYVPPERLGEYFFAVSVASLVGMVSAVGTTTMLNRSVAQEPGQVAGFLGKVLSVRLPLALVAYLLINAVTAVASPDLQTVMALASAYAILGNLWFTYSAVLLGAQKVRLRTATELVAPVIQIAFIPAAAAMGWSFEEILFVLAASNAAMLAVTAMVVHRRWGPIPIDWRHRGAWVYALASWPFLVVTGLRAANFRLDTVMVYALSSPAEAASYETAFKLLEVSRLLVRPVAAVFFPLCAALAAGAAWTKLAKTSRTLLVRTAAAGSVVAIGVALAAPWVMPTIWGPEYADSGPVLRILYLSVPVLWIGLVASFLAAALGREKPAALGQGLSLVINLGMNALLVPSLGAAGAAWTTLATQTALSLWLVILVRTTLVRRAVSEAGEVVAT
ncbi:MAG: oligosaccharide flippase family protein [Gemmatimonadetes bacterium]|nr:oligosaccharide flippase family protein [Gemmatimonadota bacterium]